MCLGPDRAGTGGRDESSRHGAESQWIVAARPLCHLQYPSAYLSRLQRIQIAAGLELCFRAAPVDSSAAGASPTTRALGSRKAPNVGRQAGGEGGAAHLRTPALSFNRCAAPAKLPPDNVFRRIISPGRAFEQKEGQCPPPTNGISKITLKVVVFHFSPVETAPTYPTPLKSFHKVGLESSSTGSSFPLILPSPFPWLCSRVGCSDGGRPPRGRSRSIPVPGAATTSSRPAGAASSSPPTPGGLGLGPRAQPSSQSFSRSYGSILPTSLAYIVPSTRGCSPWRPDAVMIRPGVGTFGPPDFQGRPGAPDTTQRRRGPPASPDSLTLPSTARVRFRNFNPIPFEGWRDARYLTGFPCLLGSTNPCASAVHMEPFPSWPSKFSFEYLLLPPRSAPAAAPPRLRRPRFQRQPPPASYSSRPGCCPDGGTSRARAPAILRETGGNQLLDGSISLFAPIPKSDERFARRYRCGPPPEVSPRLRPLRHSSPSFGSRQRRSAPESAADRLAVPASDRGASPAPIRFPPDNFKHSLTLFSKSFSSFPSRYLFAIGLSPLFSLGRNLPPYLGCIPKQPDFADSASRSRGVRAQRGCHPLWRPIPWDLRPRVFPPDLGCNPSKASGPRRQLPAGVLLSRGLGPRLPSPRGAGEGGATTRRAKCPWGKVCFSANLAGGRATNLLAPATRPHPPAVGAAGTRGGGEHVGRGAQRPGPSRALALNPSAPVANAARRGIRQAFRTRQRPSPSGASCAASLSLGGASFRGIDNDPSAGSPTETLLRLLLPLNDKVQWTFIALLSANRQASPLIEHFTRTIQSVGAAGVTELTGQIAPPTKNGHAPPPIESRKSSRSVNPYYVRTCTGGTTRPVKARGASPGRRGEVDLCTPRGGPIDQPKLELPRLLAPDLPSNGSSLRDLDCTHSNYQTREPGIVIYCHYLPCRDWVIFLAAAAFLGCGSRFSGSLSESNPNSPSPVNTMDQPGSILERPRRLKQRPIASAPQHRAGGIDGRAKVGRSDFVCESNQVHRDCRIHMGP
ncbi:hypothetical protein H6P81_021223 [Aristolochia fimbriata]|uniref:Uncharacterized protein n=1 Tax=Aristolochia fimbriata TaxID=158543 RepID=A0AAV7DQG1_ARIFI|nr:hypothetical protein H6P81_021223 [Aristolochia fimbriata]